MSILLSRDGLDQATIIHVATFGKSRIEALSQDGSVYPKIVSPKGEEFPVWNAFDKEFDREFWSIESQLSDWYRGVFSNAWKSFIEHPINRRQR